MRFSSTTVYALAIVLPAWTEAFAFIPTITVRDPSNLLSRSSLLIRKAECVSRDGKDPSDEDEEKGPINPYELEFIDYDDPNYSVDQGIIEGEEYYNPASASWEEEEIESMREERRRQNDLFQFNTYYTNFLKDKEWKGLWTEYKTSTFMEDLPEESRIDVNGIPKLAKGKSPLQVLSTASMEILEPWGPENEVIVHNEINLESNEKLPLYCPPLRKFDFRGHQGNMCVGNAFSVCDSVQLFEKSSDEVHDGPFSELRMEVGIMLKEVRMRVKLDYSVMKDVSESSDLPALHLRKIVVCRERLGSLPGNDEEVFFGDAGAPGGLYDPPPIGNDEQQYKYMYLALDGGASALFPHTIEQNGSLFDGNGWVVSLDWTPGDMRFQVDRKFFSGAKVKGLKTLELSEVGANDADNWRPNDGPQNMRQ